MALSGLFQPSRRMSAFRGKADTFHAGKKFRRGEKAIVVQGVVSHAIPVALTGDHTALEVEFSHDFKETKVGAFETSTGR